MSRAPRRQDRTDGWRVGSIRPLASRLFRTCTYNEPCNQIVGLVQRFKYAKRSLHCCIGWACPIRNEQRAHTSATRSHDAGLRVLECHTCCRGHLQTVSSLKIDVRSRLATSHFVACNDDLETPFEPRVLQTEHRIVRLA